MLIAVAFVATCSPAPETTAQTPAPPRLPSNWERFSDYGYIVTMPNGCQWIWYGNTNYRRAAIEMVPYTGPDGKQVCVEPLVSQ